MYHVVSPLEKRMGYSCLPCEMRMHRVSRPREKDKSILLESKGAVLKQIPDRYEEDRSCLSGPSHPSPGSVPISREGYVTARVVK